MKKVIYFAAILIFLKANYSFAHIPHASSFLIQSIESTYAPLEYKIERYSLNWQELVVSYLQNVIENPHPGNILLQSKKFLANLEDVHISLVTASDFKLYLPLSFAHIEGSFFVTAKPASKYHDIGALSEVKFGEDKIHFLGKCPVSIGDELLLFDGEEVLKYIESFRQVSRFGQEQTNLFHYAQMLTHRSESDFQIPTRNSATLFFYSPQAEDFYTCMAAWQRKGTPEFHKLNQTNFSISPSPNKANNSLQERRKRLRDRYNQTGQDALKLLDEMDKIFRTSVGGMEQNFSAHQSNYRLGQYETFFPLSNARSVPRPFRNNSLFRDGGINPQIVNYQDERTGERYKVGVLRIPSYDVDPLAFFFALRQAFYYFDKETDFLIIDQTNNTGGLAFAPDWVMSFLVDDLSFEDSIAFNFRSSWNVMRQKELFKNKVRPFYEVIEKIISHESDFFKSVQGLYQKSHENYEKARDALYSGQRLTGPVTLRTQSDYLKTIFELEADRIRSSSFISRQFERWRVGKGGMRGAFYTRPVYVYANEFSMSAADMFPALVQDSGRGKVIGKRTAGAGGTVVSIPFVVDMTYGVSLTTSLMERRGGEGDLIENLGITPDIEFKLTRQDARNGFKDVFDRLAKKIIDDLNSEGPSLP